MLHTFILSIFLCFFGTVIASGNQQLCKSHNPDANITPMRTNNPYELKLMDPQLLLDINKEDYYYRSLQIPLTPAEQAQVLRLHRRRNRASLCSILIMRRNIKLLIETSPLADIINLGAVLDN